MEQNDKEKKIEVVRAFTEKIISFVISQIQKHAFQSEFKLLFWWKSN